MEIYCGTFEEWTRTCAALVREGVTFKAYTEDSNRHHAYYIELTGGY